MSRSKINLKRMCDKCHRLLGDTEPMIGWKLIDDYDFEVVFKGHEGCMEQLVEELQQTLGAFSDNRGVDDVEQEG